MKSNKQLSDINKINQPVNHRELNQLNLDLLLAILQKDEKQVVNLLSVGADANFEVPDNYAVKLDESDCEQQIEIKNINKIDDQIICIFVSVNGLDREMLADYKKSRPVLEKAIEIDDSATNIIISLIEAGADTTQRENFDILAQAVENEKKELVHYLVEKGLNIYYSYIITPNPSSFSLSFENASLEIMQETIGMDKLQLFQYAKDHGLLSPSYSMSAFDLAYVAGDTEIMNYFITRDFDPAKCKIKNFLIDDNNIKTLELLLNAGVIPENDFINSLLHQAQNNIELLNNILKYDFIKYSGFIKHIFYNLLIAGKSDFIKVLMEHGNKNELDLIYESYNFYIKHFVKAGELPRNLKIDNSLNDYIFTYQTTNKIIKDKTLTIDEIKKFNDLLIKDARCAEIFLGQTKYHILDNGDSFFNSLFDCSSSENDLVALFEPSFIKNLEKIISKTIFDQLINDHKTGILDVLEQKYINALKNLEEILIHALNPEIMNSELMDPTSVAGLDLNESMAFGKEFFRNKILTKIQLDSLTDLNYLNEFFNSDSESALVNGFAYLLQNIPGLVVAIRPIIETKNLHSEDIFSDIIIQAFDFYYANPELNCDENGHVYVMGQSDFSSNNTNYHS